MQEIASEPIQQGIKIAIVVSQWNELITTKLREGAEKAAAEAKAEIAYIVTVPGAWEIPIVVQKLLARGDVDCAAAVGCVMQGETSHAGALATDVAGALMKIQLESRKPVGWGVIAAETMEQALQRAGGKVGNKGHEAVKAVLMATSALNQIS